MCETPPPPDANTQAWARLVGEWHVLFTTFGNRNWDWWADEGRWIPVGPPLDWVDPWPDRVEI